MPRLDPIAAPYPDDVAPVLAAMMPPGVEPLKLFRTLAHNPRVLDKVRASNLLDRGSLERRDRELVILRTTARCGSEYEWGVHVTIFARRFGFDDAQIRATREGSGLEAFWSGRERQLIALVDELHEARRVTDATWSRLAEHYTPRQLVELVVLSGFYQTISFVTNAFEIELEEAAERFGA